MGARERLREHFREQLATTEIEDVSSADGALRVLKLRRPGHGGVGGVDVAVIGAGFKRTAITSDLGLGVNGLLSARGVGLEELVAAASTPAVVGWFLARLPHVEAAREMLDVLIVRRARADDLDAAERLRDLRDGLDEGDWDARYFMRSLADAGAHEPDLEGLGYDARDAALLEAIVERLAALVTR